MKIGWQNGRNAVCFGKVFKDGFGAIIMLGEMRKPWIWKVTSWKIF